MDPRVKTALVGLSGALVVPFIQRNLGITLSPETLATIIGVLPAVWHGLEHLITNWKKP